MTHWIILGGLTLANAAAAGLAWWFCRRARRCRDIAHTAAKVSTDARHDAACYAAEAKRAAARDCDNPVLPFVPAAGWHEEHGQGTH